MTDSFFLVGFEILARPAFWLLMVIQLAVIVGITAWAASRNPDFPKPSILKIVGFFLLSGVIITLIGDFAGTRILGVRLSDVPGEAQAQLMVLCAVVGLLYGIAFRLGHHLATDRPSAIKGDR